MRTNSRFLSLGLSLVLVTLCSACGSSKIDDPAVSTDQIDEGTDPSTAAEEDLLNPDSPVTITIWNYYNGDQLAAFDNLVSEFNDTIGMEKGIIVDAVSQSNIANLADELLKSADKKAGAQDLPDLAAIYPETAYILAQSDLLVDLDTYFTQEEQAEYIPDFISEGRLTDNGPLYLFPISKSTEIFAVNATDWADFEAASGISIDSIKTMEDMANAAEQYYLWTDELTPDTPENGKSLYGRDSLANYIYVGAAQLGHPLFTVDTDSKVSVDLDRDTFRTLWNDYYIPFINGYFGASANYRSDDAKTGTILSMTCSSSAINYFPTTVTLTDDSTHDITAVFKKPLSFQNQTSELYVQQGADYCILHSTDAREYASSLFLKWITDTQQNSTFSIQAGYSPVTQEANTEDSIRSSYAAITNSEKETNILNSLLISSEIFTEHTTYSCKPFQASKDVRSYLENALGDISLQDRAAVTEQIAQGVSRADAVAPYSTDDYFDTWFDTLTNEVNSIVDP